MLFYFTFSYLNDDTQSFHNSSYNTFKHKNVSNFSFLFPFIKNIFLEIHLIKFQYTMKENKNYEKKNWFSFLQI